MNEVYSIQVCLGLRGWRVSFIMINDSKYQLIFIAFVRDWARRNARSTVFIILRYSWKQFSCPTLYRRVFQHILYAGWGVLLLFILKQFLLKGIYDAQKGANFILTISYYYYVQYSVFAFVEYIIHTARTLFKETSVFS